jgi:hypothetical protein
LTAEQQWTSAPDQALRFENAKSAMDFCARQKLSTVVLQVVLPNGDEFDVSLDDRTCTNGTP